jgi:peptide/nickel transport system permease protein
MIEQAGITVPAPPAAPDASLPDGLNFRRRRRIPRFFRDPKAALSCLVLAFFLALAVFPTVIAPYGENTQVLLDAHEQPSLKHPLGVDRIGRDVFSRTVYGTRTSISVGLVAVAVACAIGVPLGLIAGYAGRWVDEILMRIVDAWFAFPTLIMLLAIVSILGPGIRNVMIAIGLGSFPIIARLVRGQTLSVKERDYVLAVRASGADSFRIMRAHLLPNTVQPVIVQASLMVGFAVLTEAGLSFLGVGIQPPAATWGIVIQEGFPDIRINVWASIGPGVAITAFVLAVNLLGDRLRDVLDPHLRGTR